MKNIFILIFFLTVQFGIAQQLEITHIETPSIIVISENSCTDYPFVVDWTGTSNGHQVKWYDLDSDSPNTPFYTSMAIYDYTFTYNTTLNTSELGEHRLRCTVTNLATQEVASEIVTVNVLEEYYYEDVNDRIIFKEIVMDLTNGLPTDSNDETINQLCCQYKSSVRITEPFPDLISFDSGQINVDFILTMVQLFARSKNPYVLALSTILSGVNFDYNALFQDVDEDLVLAGIYFEPTKVIPFENPLVEGGVYVGCYRHYLKVRLLETDSYYRKRLCDGTDDPNFTPIFFTWSVPDVNNVCNEDKKMVRRSSHPSGVDCDPIPECIGCSNDFTGDDPKSNSSSRNTIICGDFGFEQTELCKYDFFNCSENVSFLWNFGDGTVSNDQNPSHTYIESGTYTVSLTVSSDDESMTSTETIIVISCDASILTGIISGEENPTTTETNGYSAQAFGGTPPYTYVWDFDGGDISPASPIGEGPISALFSQPDIYNVSVFITDSNGLTTDVNLEVECDDGGTLLVDFSHSPAYPDAAVFFTGEYNIWDVQGFLTFEWKIMDGTDLLDTGSTQDKIFTFTEAGDYQVTFTKCDDGNCVSVTKTVTVSNYSSGEGFCIDIKARKSANSPILYRNAFCACNPSAHEYTPVELSPGESGFFGFNRWNEEGANESPSNCDNDPPINYTPHSDGCLFHYSMVFTNQKSGATITANQGTDWLCWNNTFDEQEVFFDEWGCWDLNIYAFDGNFGTPVNDERTFECIAYVNPKELEISSVDLLNNGTNCNDYFLKVEADFGARQSGDIINNPGTPCHGLENYYKKFTWEAFDVNTGDPINILNGSGVNGSRCVSIDLSDPYFEQFEFDVRSFIYRVTVEDHLGNTETTLEHVEIPADIYIALPSVINRCPEVESKVNNNLSEIVYGGTSPYTIEWVDPQNILDLTNGDENPILNPLAQGIYDITMNVTDANGCTATSGEIIVSVDYLQVDAGSSPIKACGNANKESFRRLGGSDGTAFGGSGGYTYEWSPQIGLDDPYSPNPIVSDDQPGNRWYSLIVTDESGCTAQSQVLVQFQSSNPVADASYLPPNGAKTLFVCFGKNIQLGTLANGSCTDCIGPVIGQWTDDHPNDDYDQSSFRPTLGESMTSESGKFNYNIEVRDHGTGCMDEDNTNVTVRNQILHKGYESDIVWTSDYSAPLWSDSPDENMFILDSDPEYESGAEAPLSYHFSPSLNRNITSYYNNIPNGGSFYPTPDKSSMTMKVKDRNGCSEEVLTNRALTRTGSPKLTIEALNGVGNSVCTGSNICWKVTLDTRYEGTFHSLLPQEIVVGYVIKKNISILTGSVTGGTEDGKIILKLIDGSKGIYEAEFCYSPQNTFVAWTVQEFCVLGDLNDLGYVTESQFDGCFSFYNSVPGWQIPQSTGFCFDSQNSNSIQFSCQAKHLGSSTNINFGTCKTSDCENVNISAGNYLKLVSTEDGWITMGITDVEVRVKSGAWMHAYMDPCTTPYFKGGSDGRSDLEETSSNPTQTSNLNVYPNPFIESLTLELKLSKSIDENIVSLNLLDLTGKKLKTIVKEQQFTSGSHKIYFNSQDLKPGVYFIEMIANDDHLIKKIIKVN